MKKRAICEANPTNGYWSALGGVEIKEIEYGIDTHIVCVSNAWHGAKSYHRVKVYYTSCGAPFIKLHGYRLYLDDCLSC